jgi:hypothetical protein
MTLILEAPAFFKTTSNSDFSSTAAPPASPALGRCLFCGVGFFLSLRTDFAQKPSGRQ